MADLVKITVEEINGIELAQPTEYALIAENIPYDNTGTNITAIDVEAAITELSSRVGGFSKRFITAEITIASTDEMILSDYMDVETNGCIEINGLLTILGE